MDMELLAAIKAELNPIKQDIETLKSIMAQDSQRLKTVVEEDLPQLRSIVEQDSQRLKTVVEEDLPQLRSIVAQDSQRLKTVVEEALPRLEALLEHSIPQQINLLAEGHALVLERLPNPEKVEVLDDRVDTLETVVKQHSTDIAQLKKAL